MGGGGRWINPNGAEGAQCSHTFFLKFLDFSYFIINFRKSIFFLVFHSVLG